MIRKGEHVGVVERERLRLLAARGAAASAARSQRDKAIAAARCRKTVAAAMARKAEAMRGRLSPED